MAQKRIKAVQRDIMADKLRLLYDDGSQGEIDISKIKEYPIPSLTGLTLKQAKLLLGIKK